MLPGATRDTPNITPDWEVRRDLIDGVRLREVRNIVTRNGVTTEIFRTDWDAATAPVVHAIHVSLRSGAISAWHCHERQVDRLFVVHGSLRLVLYDGREASCTRGKVDVLILSPLRPTQVAIPPGVWHGLQNLEPDTSMFVNMFDHAYRYDDPDEWRLPPDTDAIPWRF